MDILLLIGLTIFIGTLAGKLCSQFKVPQVTGFILTGFILGKSVTGLWTQTNIDVLAPVTNLALGIIGFMIGSELKLEIFQKWGRSIYSILLSEAFVAFATVCLFVTLITQKLYLGLFLGAIAAATDPATTVNVLWERKARGPLTSTIMAIVALDDALALMIYGFASVFAKSMMTHEHFSIFHSIVDPLIEVSVALLIGVSGGYLLFWFIRFVIKDRERTMPFSIGIMVMGIGLSIWLKVDLILSAMTLGAVFVNLAPVESKEIIESVKRFSLPVIILFFGLVGARLDVRLFLGTGVAILALTYVFGASLGKVAGAFLGGVIGRAQPQVKKYLGWCLFSQAGVAIGLAISIYNNLSHAGPEAVQTGILIVNVVVAAIFVFQVVGPLSLRFAIEKAGEADKNITEEDIIESYQVMDFIEKDIPVIRENTSLYSLVGIIKESDSESHHFCVVNEQDRLLGVISLGDLKETFLNQEIELNQLVLARDIAVPCPRVIESDRPLKEAIDLMRLKSLDFLPVVKDLDSRKLIGIIHYRLAMAEISRTLFKRRGEL